MTNSYKLPNDLTKSSEYFLTKNKKIEIVINSHSDNFEKGQAILTQNLYTFVVSGYKEILHSDGKVGVHKFESAILKKGSYVVSERFEENQKFKNILFFFSDDFVQNIEKPIKTNSTHKTMSFFYKIGKDDLINDLVFQIEKYLNNSSLKSRIDDLIELKFTELMIILFSLNSHIFDFIQNIITENESKLISIFEKHYKTNLQLSDYAHLANRSISSLKRDFLKETGTTTSNWITEKRLINAKQQLLDTEKNISEIAWDLGFESLSHFSRVFKNKFKKSPKEMRNELYG